MLATLPNGKTVSDCRSEIAGQAASRFVERQEYCTLLISARQLERANEPSAELLGLLDPSSGERFYIEEEKLFPAAR